MDTQEKNIFIVDYASLYPQAQRLTFGAAQLIRRKVIESELEEVNRQIREINDNGDLNIQISNS